MTDKMDLQKIRKVNKITKALIAVFILTMVAALASCGNDKKDKKSQEVDETIAFDYTSSYSDDETTMEYKAKYSDKMLTEGDANTENRELAKVAIGLAGSAYDMQFVADALVNMGFDHRDINNYGSYDKELSIEDNDHVAYTIATKKAGDYIIYCIPVRGTASNSEWYSNFNLGKSGDHEGFYNAEAELSEQLSELLEDDGYDKDHRIFFITGHSRGAAVANILAGQLTADEKYGEANKIFCYTFACPSVSKNADDTLKNIYNYNNSGDIIPALPLSDWGYKRFGTTIESGEFSEDVITKFEEISGQEWNGADNTELFEGSMSLLIQNEDMYNTDISKITMTIMACKLGGENETTAADLIKYIVNMEKIKGTEIMTRMAINKATGNDEDFTEILKEVFADSEEVYEGASDNKDELMEKITDMWNDSDGNLAKTVWHGHAAEIYMAWMES